MDESSEKMLGVAFTISHECACSELDISGKSFTVDCSMEGIDEDITFVNSEAMIFELNNDVYELSVTSYNFSYRFEGSPFIDSEVNIFYLDNGVVTGCKSDNCTCTACGDNESIGIYCGDNETGYHAIECSEGYTGTSANTFDFRVIRESSPSKPYGQPADLSTGFLRTKYCLGIFVPFLLLGIGLVV